MTGLHRRREQGTAPPRQQHRLYRRARRDVVVEARRAGTVQPSGSPESWAMAASSACASWPAGGLGHERVCKRKRAAARHRRKRTSSKRCSRCMGSSAALKSRLTRWARTTCEHTRGAQQRS